MSGHHDVVIVGLGPVGAVLAGLLGLCRIATHVIERDAALHDLPRAVHFDGEVMRVFQTLGVAEQVAAVSRVNPGMRFVDPAGRLLLDWPRPAEISPQGWHASWRFHQPDLERILRSALSRWPRVSVALGEEVVAAEQRDGRVNLRVRDRAGGERAVSAAHVVGCDGGRSFVRGCIGGTAEDLGFHERWLVVDVLLKREMPELGDHTIQHCNPRQPATYVRCPGRRRRWEIALGNGAEGEAVGPEAVWSRLRRWIGPDDAEIERAAVYTFHSVIAGRWRSGRMLIAGDAAHQTPPFMGQGMCAGIRDAANLAWKLALCVRGRADAALLESYQTERIPHVRRFIETAVRLGRLINATDPEAALAAAYRLPDGSARMESLSPVLGPGLATDGDDAAGRLFPQPCVAGVPLDDRVGYAPALIARTDLWRDAGRPQGRLDEKGIALIAAENGSAPALALRQAGAGAVMLRPDRHVLGSVRRPDDLAALLDRTPASPLP